MTYSAAYNSIYKGDYKQIVFSILDGSNPIDFTNADLVRWAISSSEDFDPSLVKSYPASGIALSYPSSGILTLTLDSVDTETLAAGAYFQQLEYRIAGNTKTAFVGTFRILPTII